MKSLDVDLLRVFAAVAETKSFTAAGQHLYRTQSTVGLQLKRLEKQLDCQLLYRAQGHVNGLTSAGATLLEYAHEMIRMNDRATAALATRKLEGHIRLGLADEAAHQDLSEALARFQAQHPLVHLEVTCASSGELEEWIHARRVDLALVNRCDREPTPGVHSCQLFQERLVWVKHEGVRWQENAPLPLICFPLGCAYRARAIQTLDLNGVAWRSVYSSSSCHGVWSAVSAGLGVAVMPARSVTRDQPAIVVGHAVGLPDLAPVDVVLLYGADSQQVEPQQSLRLCIQNRLQNRLVGL